VVPLVCREHLELQVRLAALVLQALQELQDRWERPELPELPERVVRQGLLVLLGNQEQLEILEQQGILAPLDQMVHQALVGLSVPLVHQEHRDQQDLRDQPVLMDHLAPPELQEPQELAEHQEALVLLGTLVGPVHLVHPGHLDQQVLLDHQEHQGLQVPQVLRVLMGQLEAQALPVLQGQLVLLVQAEHPVHPVLLVLPGLQGPTDNRVAVERRVLVVLRDQLVLLEDLVQRVLQGQMVRLVQQDLLVLLVLQDHRVLKVLQVHKELQVQVVQQEQLEQPDLLARPEVADPQVHQAPRAVQVPPVPLEPQVQVVRLVRRAAVEAPVRLEPQDRWAQLEFRDLREVQALRDLLGQQEHLEHLVLVDPSVLLGHPEPVGPLEVRGRQGALANLGLRERQVALVLLVVLVSLVARVILVPAVLQDHKDQQDRQDQLVRPEWEDPLERRVLKDLQEVLVSLEPPEHLVLQVPKELLVALDCQAAAVHRDQLAHPVHLAPLVLQDRQVLLDLEALMALQEHQDYPERRGRWVRLEQMEPLETPEHLD